MGLLLLGRGNSFPWTPAGGYLFPEGQLHFLFSLGYLDHSSAYPDHYPEYIFTPLANGRRIVHGDDEDCGR
jgi:hypothetical protein